MSNRKLSGEAFLKARLDEASARRAVSPDWRPGIKFFSFAHYKAKDKRRARWEENRRRRAALYAEYKGEIKRDDRLNEWHSTLNALSMGAA